jgi:two-component system NtrC family response regulator
MAQILVVDDEPKMTALVCGELEDAGHTVTTSIRAADALGLIESRNFDIVITDLSMPEVSGLAIMERGIDRGADVIIMTAYGSVESAIAALRKGAADYLLKPFSLEELVMLVNRLAKQQKLTQLKEHFESETKTAKLGRNQSSADSFIGESPAAVKVKKLITQVALSEATVLLTGRSGTGKEIAARMVHDLSPRSAHPFIAINCAAITETLLESELFGHEKGAFTGASARKRGRFELADSGTIFLDEIGEMPLPMQTKLLRVLEERQIVRVGGVDTVRVNVRVVAATNRNLKSEVAAGKFREDLYFRLNVFPIELPLLSDRERDVVLIAESMLRSAKYSFLPLPAEITRLLLSYHWPGNIRELRNVIERALILSGGEPLERDDFDLLVDVESEPIDSPTSGSTGASTGMTGSTAGARAIGLEDHEKQMILSAIEQSGGNKTEAAKLLKITRRRLYSRMKVHGIPW